LVPVASCIVTTGCVPNATPAAIAPPGCVVKAHVVAAASECPRNVTKTSRSVLRADLRPGFFLREAKIGMAFRDSRNLPRDSITSTSEAHKSKGPGVDRPGVRCKACASTSVPNTAAEACPALGTDQFSVKYLHVYILSDM
jgi:hypothetical protein